jgi:hypothetical protein
MSLADAGGRRGRGLKPSGSGITRNMPPWHLGTKLGIQHTFKTTVLLLTDAQIATIVSWVELAPARRPEDMPAAEAMARRRRVAVGQALRQPTWC